ncbi:MAG: SsrA-binding protein SmpB [bacterium]
MPSLVYNKNANRNYHLLETFEAGVVLTGAEVKSLRNQNAKLQGAYVTIAKGELWLIGAHIGRYAPAGPQPEYDPSRARKLLVHKRQLMSLLGKKKEKGLTLVPLELYTKGHQIKLSFAIARGKKLYDKREDLKKRDLDRDIRRLMKPSHIA